MGKSKGEKINETQKRLRHVVNTEYLAKFNEYLSPIQKERLGMTPFKSLIDIKEKIKISGPLLRELVGRWDVHSQGIRVGNKVISFTCLDVCFGLGLPIVGEPVHIDDGNESRVKELLNGGVMTASSIEAKMGELTHDNDVDDFCRLYILLAFQTLYFPKTTREVHTLPFRLLNDLGSLCKYNWGVEVYRVLVDSVNRVAACLNEGKQQDSVYIAGCAALLQIWTVDHLSLRPTPEKTRFPRILDWINVGTGKCLVANIFDSEKVVEDLPINDEDRTNEVLNDAIKNVLREHSSQKKSLLERQKEIGMKLSMVEDDMLAFVNGERIWASTSHVESETVAEQLHGPPYVHVTTNSNQLARLNELYYFCTRRPDDSRKGDVLVDIDGHILTRLSLTTLKPRTWLDNYVFQFTSNVLMQEEKNRTGCVSRFILSSYVHDKVVGELPMFKTWSQKPWTFEDFIPINRHAEQVLADLQCCKLIFAPAVFDGHWVCYVVNKEESRMYVLDSLHTQRVEDQVMLDVAMCHRLEELLKIILGKDVIDPPMSIVWENMPKQHNSDDCGMYVLKYLELWNGENTMAAYSVEDVHRYRKEFVWKWVLHERNTCKEKVLADAKLPADLKYM